MDNQMKDCSWIEWWHPVPNLFPSLPDLSSLEIVDGEVPKEKLRSLSPTRDDRKGELLDVKYTVLTPRDSNTHWDFYVSRTYFMSHVRIKSVTTNTKDNFQLVV